MSVSMTLPAVLARTKTVTRRHEDSWAHLAEGDELELIEKGMGLPKGSKQVVVAKVRIVSVRIERLRLIDQPGELVAEGFPDMTPAEFVTFWLKGHGYRNVGTLTGPDGSTPCRRIEWEYL